MRQELPGPLRGGEKLPRAPTGRDNPMRMLAAPDGIEVEAHAFHPGTLGA
jgi:hypothetical protein